VGRKRKREFILSTSESAIRPDKVAVRPLVFSGVRQKCAACSDCLWRSGYCGSARRFRTGIHRTRSEQGLKSKTVYQSI